MKVSREEKETLLEINEYDDNEFDEEKYVDNEVLYLQHKHILFCV